MAAAQEKASSYRDDEVQRATTDINLRHAQMQRSDASRELRLHEPNVHIESEVRIVHHRINNSLSSYVRLIEADRRNLLTITNMKMAFYDIIKHL